MQLLLRVKDKINHESIAKCVNCLKAGDIVDIMPDSHVWVGTETLTNPDWRIINAPNLTELAANTFLVPEPEDDFQNPNPLKQARAFMFDLEHPSLPQDFKDYLADDTRTNPIYTTDFRLGQFMALKKVRPTRRNEATL